MNEKDVRKLAENSALSLEEIKDILPNIANEEAFRLYVLSEIKSMKKEIKEMCHFVSNGLEQYKDDFMKIIENWSAEIIARMDKEYKINEANHKWFVRLIVILFSLVISALGVTASIAGIIMGR